MITTYFKLLKNAFCITPWISIPCIMISVLTIFFIFITSIALFFDLFYKYKLRIPHNFLLDHMIPIIACLSPTGLILLLSPDYVTWIEKFGFIIISHIFILIPLMYFWFINSQKKLLTNNYKHHRVFGSPRFYLDITIAIIYPAVWGFFLYFLRYLRLGNEINITNYLNDTNMPMFILWPFILIGLFYGIKQVSILKSFLWEEFSNLIVSLSLYLIQYKIFFNLFEKLYQVSFLWITFVICDPYIYMQKSFIRRQIHRLYLYPVIFWLLILLIFLIEMYIMNGKIYYSFYILITFFGIRTIIQFLNRFNGPANNWIELCCYSDYVNYNWNKPHYPKSFWLLFKDMHATLNLSISPSIQNHINDIIINWELRDDKLRKRNNYIFKRIINNPRTGIKHRLRLTYYKWTKIN